jgi:hypothetical protein
MDSNINNVVYAFKHIYKQFCLFFAAVGGGTDQGSPEKQAFFDLDAFMPWALA